MVFFFKNGRLGNQFFQYVGLKKLFYDHKLILIGFGSFFNLIHKDSLVHEAPYICNRQKLITIFKFFLIFLSKIRLITESKEDFNDSNYIITTKGLFKNIIYFSFGFFQSKNFVDLNNKIVFKSQVNNGKFQSLFDDEVYLNKTLIFLHIRRGDYLYWPSKKYPAVLGFSWYKEQIDFFKSCFPNYFFVVVTDDVNYAEDIFLNEENFYLSRNDELNDFLLMINCNHGILSPSSFAFWAGFFLKQKNNNAILIAPKFWIGHRIKKWFPNDLILDWITYN